MTVDLKRIKAERIAKGYTQDQVAAMMGWKDRAPYAKRENGIVSIGADELIRLASIFGIDKNNVGIFFKVNVPEKERSEEV
ncbi:helix-turn-helix domain-containing protein [Vagococcus salmoninarum]|uniref:helix-turn-helix domain-containing protein n=1 Tax=Vagococcus salmoninarum TaxID=2739 RepID=UPI0028D73B7E|nr:helix-turn-helix transcriptional regulator [Vagococcus salmoninarum]